MQSKIIRTAPQNLYTMHHSSSKNSKASGGGNGEAAAAKELAACMPPAPCPNNSSSKNSMASGGGKGEAAAAEELAAAAEEPAASSASAFLSLCLRATNGASYTTSEAPSY